MVQCRLADPAAGVADPRMAAYLDGHHHPRQALLPRVAFVALVGTTVVGYIGGHLTRRYQCDGELQYLFVAPQYRRTGIASELLRLLAPWFAHEGARKVCVNVDPDNGGARAFYTLHGAISLHPFWLVWNDIRAVCGAA
jgi:GNAT superfamily N-acetyltransferase